MSSIKLDVNIKLPKVEMFSRKEKPSLFNGVPSKYKFVVFNARQRFWLKNVRVF